jgi:hypothetical protein
MKLTGLAIHGKVYFKQALLLLLLSNKSYNSL